MGIEKISGQAAYQSHATQAAQVNKVSAAPAAETNNSQDSVNNAAHIAAVMQVSTSQKANADSNSSNNGNSGAQSSFKQQGEQKEASMQKLKDIQKVINHNTVAEFGYNEPTNRITIKIKDKDTDEVIKEIPSEKALEMLAKAWELAGILVDEKR